MSVKTYSYKADKNLKLSKNFTVREFRCKDGSDIVIIDSELVKILQSVRDNFGIPVTVNSGYRTQSYNTKIGGSSSSYHVRGKAADIKINGVDPLKIAVYAEKLLDGKGGIEMASYGADVTGYVHIDVRNGMWRAIRDKSSSSGYTSYSTVTPAVKHGSSGRHVTVLTRKLKKLGYLSTPTDVCGTVTVNGIKKFQSANGLVSDGIFGIKSWAKLVEKI